MTKSSIKAKLEALINPAPVNEGANLDSADYDVLDGTTATLDHRTDSDSESNLAHDIQSEEGDVEMSDLRRANAISLAELDAKYRGKKVDRRVVFDSNEPSNDRVLTVAKKAQSRKRKKSDNSEEITSDESDLEMTNEIESESDESNDEDKITVEKSGQSEAVTSADVKTVISSVDNEEQIKKGKAVEKQSRLWDKLLAVRIKMQACMRAVNRMPRNDIFDILSKNATSETKNDLKNAQKNIRKIAEQLLVIDDQLLLTYSRTKHLVTGDKAKLDSDEEIESSADEKSDNESDATIFDYRGGDSGNESGSDRNFDATNRIKKIKGKYRGKNLDLVLNKRTEDYLKFRNDTIAKWDDRTRLRGSIKPKKDFEKFNSTILKQIEKVLMDRDRLLKRTRTKRSDFSRLDNDNNDKYDEEIFDDDDFYQQLLKELIDRKSADISDPVAISRNWLEVQRWRQKRAKKSTIDTGASKGRKIRYEILTKLTNFHAANPNLEWSDQSRAELFRSLFM